MLTYETYTLNY